MKISRWIAIVMLILSAPLALHADGGCVNSPENPTALLGLVGVAGAGFSWWRRSRG